MSALPARETPTRIAPENEHANIAMETPPFEDVFPIEQWDVPLSCSFPGDVPSSVAIQVQQPCGQGIFSSDLL